MSYNIPLLNKDQLIEVFNYTKTATAIHIGELAVIQMANDAMLKIWDKDNTVIGKSLEEALPELRGQPFAEMFRKVWLEGITISGTETAADLLTEGKILTYYFDFEYRAIKDDKGQTICVLHTAVDVTERVQHRLTQEHANYQQQALRKEQALNEELAASNEELNAVNEELSKNQEELRALNETLERRVESRVKDLSESEAKFRILSNELATINEEMAAANEELITSNEELFDARERLQQTFDQLEDKEIALRLAVEAANFGTWHIHSGTRKFVTSARLRELFGFTTSQEISIEEALDQIQPEYRQYVADKLENAINGNGDYDVSYPVIGLVDQNIRWLRAVGNLKTDKSGEFSSFTGVVMDISIMKKDEQRKNDFIGMVSHELKTPLTSINGYLQLLQRKTSGNEGDFIATSLDMAARQVKKMTSMINGFLNISRLESGKIVLNCHQFYLGDLVQHAVEEARIMDTGHLIQFDPCNPISIYADYDKISNVISNILSNAVKYTLTDKRIRLHCGIVDGMAQISVKDNGIGISKKDAGRIFERYYRIVENNHVSGFGIGLYLSAEIIARHQGNIWLDSEPGKGSTFYFNLPLSGPV